MRPCQHVNRCVSPRHDGQRRWDLAYQLLLRWTMEGEDGTNPGPSSRQEERNERCLVRTGVDQPSATDPDD
jgi:hypothetical protein